MPIPPRRRAVLSAALDLPYGTEPGRATIEAVLYALGGEHSNERRVGLAMNIIDAYTDIRCRRAVRTWLDKGGEPPALGIGQAQHAAVRRALQALSGRAPAVTAGTVLPDDEPPFPEAEKPRRGRPPKAETAPAGQEMVPLPEPGGALDRIDEIAGRIADERIEETPQAVLAKAVREKQDPLLPADDDDDDDDSTVAGIIAALYGDAVPYVPEARQEPVPYVPLPWREVLVPPEPDAEADWADDDTTAALLLCSACRLEKPEDDFYADRKNPRGRMYVCKACGAERKAEYRKQRRERQAREAEAAAAAALLPPPEQPDAGPVFPETVLADAAADVLSCNECLQEKPVTEFYRDNASARGRMYKCKDCSNKARVVYGRKRSARFRKEAEAAAARAEAAVPPAGGASPSSAPAGWPADVPFIPGLSPEQARIAAAMNLPIAGQQQQA